MQIIFPSLSGPPTGKDAEGMCAPVLRIITFLTASTKTEKDYQLLNGRI